jgi:hypothetical protein
MYKLTRFLIALILQITAVTAFSQTVPQGINYQGIAKNSSGALLVNQALGIRISVLSGSASGALVWQETHQDTTNQFGLFHLVIGQGSSTGSGSASSFSNISWGSAPHYLKVDLDVTGGTSYVTAETSQLLSVPYSLYSLKSAGLSSPLALNDLTDVNSGSALSGQTIKWNGSEWIAAMDNDSDTALFAWNAGAANTADTSSFAFSAGSTDSAVYATSAGSAVFATTAGTAANADHAVHSDTATYSLNCLSPTNDWNLNGNSGIVAPTNFLGTINPADLVIKTNNVERMRITSAGKMGFGTSTPTATMHVVGIDGFVAQGTFGSGILPVTGAGTRMLWYSKKAAFRAGHVVSTQWDDVNIGNYSFATGYSVSARGYGSVATGQNSIAYDSCGVAMGYACSAVGRYGIAMGNNAQANGIYSVSLGRGPSATGIAAQAIGYHVIASGDYSTALGYYTVASGDNSVALGYQANTNNMNGSFVFGDQAALTSTYATAPNQFLVRASGGTVFYTNSTASTGVSLPAGGGSWTTLSDKNKKEHFRKLNGEEVLNKIAAMDIYSWNYKSQSDDIRHVGPFAQDFYAAFKLGESDTTISMVDIEGINMLALKTLEQRTRQLNEKIKEVEVLSATLKEMEKQKKDLEARMQKIESMLEKKEGFSALKAKAE